MYWCVSHLFNKGILLTYLLKTGVQGIVPKKIFEFCIAVTVGEFRYIFRERKQTFLSLRRGSDVLSPVILFNSALLAVTVGEFWYIFGERKQTFLSPKTEVRVIVPGKIFEFCIAVGEFWYILENENKLFSPLKRGSGVLFPGKF